MKRFLFIPLILIATKIFAGSMLPYPLFQAIDGNGNPIRGGLLYTYEIGTTTNKAAYTDNALTTPADNPIVLDSEGRAEIYLSGGYKMNLKTSSGGQVPGWPVDNIYGMTATSAGRVSLNIAHGCDLAAAITAIGATPTTLIVDCAEILANGVTATVPATMTLEFVRGGSVAGISGGDTETLALSSVPIAPDDMQIFGSNLTVTIAKCPDVVNPEWWGIDGTADEVQINQALVAAPSCTVKLNNDYTTADSIEVTGGNNIECSSKSESVITADLAKPAIISSDQTTTQSHVTIKNCSIDMVDGSAGSIGIDLTNISSSVVDNVKISSAETGIYGETDIVAPESGVSYYNSILNSTILTTTTGIHTDDGSNDWFIRKVKIDGNTQAIKNEGGTNTIIACDLENFTTYGIWQALPTGNGGSIVAIGNRLETSSAATAIRIEASTNPSTFIGNQITGASLQVFNLSYIDDQSTHGGTRAIDYYNYFPLGASKINLGSSVGIASGGNLVVENRNGAFLANRRITSTTNINLFNQKWDFLDDPGGALSASSISSEYFTGAATNAGTTTLVANYNGNVVLTTDTANDDSASIIYTHANFENSYNVKFEALVKIDNLATSYLFVGITDAAFTDKTTMPSDYAGIEFDADVNAANLYMVTNDVGAGEVKLDTGVDIVADTFIKVFIDLTDSENPAFYIDDVDVTGAFTGTVAASFVTYPYVHTQTLTTAARIGTVDYIEMWEDRVQ